MLFPFYSSSPTPHAALTTKLHEPSVKVQGAWQMDDSVKPPMYYVEENANLTMTCNYYHEKHLTLGFMWSNQQALGDALSLETVQPSDEHFVHSHQTSRACQEQWAAPRVAYKLRF
ncbi:hypothetical protein E2C01_005578 [Portunus trituberculatus]|uniref:Uncharacterized protein n=1 Tax=Portunus trituberculatus TaxID=210409 RepID=A0A5B7CZI0_PORTR|nr:hypothetical protein [Portunus trituberculatus]